MARLHLCLGALSLALGMGLLANRASANLIINGDFQTGDTTGWTAVAPGVTVDPNSGPAGTGDFALHVTAANSQYVIQANGNASIGVGAGEQYNVSFDVKANTFNPGDSALSYVYFQKAFGGNYPAYTILENTPPLNDGLWHTITATFTADDGPFLMGIYADVGGGVRDFTIDNIQVNPAVAVPEPASLAIFGLGGLALVVRRRRVI